MIEQLLVQSLLEASSNIQNSNQDNFSNSQQCQNVIRINNNNNNINVKDK